ncbi:HTH_Tnp_Tc3_2 domain-containing protein [Trichonephila clavipes]|nr:HTH_Tnp_Tc3_2 domain-containing protein [Trichonephila clavipes]
MGDIGTVVGVGNSSVSRILGTFQDSGSLSTKIKGKSGLKQKTTPRTDKILLRNKKNKSKKNRQRPSKGLLDLGVEVSPLNIRKMFLEVSRKATRPRKEKFPVQKKRTFSMG